MSQVQLSKSAIVLISLEKNVTLPISALMEEVGDTNRSRFRNNILNQLIKAQLVEPTQKDFPQSPKQEYTLTDKGREVLK
jgi:ATP-dependent DNA helicase RecG